MKLSACIITFNEEHYISRAITSLRQNPWIDDIVVVDSGSIDNTVQICKDLGCNVVLKEWQNDFALQRNFALGLCKHEWVIICDADEWYPKATLDKINEMIANAPPSLGCIQVMEISEVKPNSFDGHVVDINYINTHSPEWTNKDVHHFKVDEKDVFLTYPTRIVNRNRGRWINKVHETFQLYNRFRPTRLDKQFVVHHEKSTQKQDMSHARYDSLYNQNCLFVGQYNDFTPEETSIQSVITLDDMFFKITTEVIDCTKFIEVGCFDGQTSMFIKDKLPSTDVYAFEANPYNYSEFHKALSSKNINHIHKAVSNTNDDVTFRIRTKLNDIDIPKIKGNDSLLFRADGNVEYEDYTIRSTTIDSFFSEKINTGDSISMWVDLEGVAYEALQGALNTLSKVDVLKVEVESRQLWKQQKLDKDIIYLLALYGFVPLIRDFEYPEQYNILFVKMSLSRNPKFNELLSKYDLQATRSSGLPGENDRTQRIRSLYRKVLGREADINGLQQYSNSQYSLNEIETFLLNSDERALRHA